MSKSLTMQAVSLPALALATAILAVLPLMLSDWIVFLIALALAKGMVVLGVVLLLRGGLISFGQALYFAIGAYTVGFLSNRFVIGESLIALPLATALSAVVAAVLGLLLTRFRGIYFAMLSLAFSMILYTVLIKFYDFSGGTDGLSVRGFRLAGFAPANPALAQYYVIVVLSAGVAYLGARFLASPLGYLMQAVRYNEIRIEYLGVSASHAEIRFGSIVTSPRTPGGSTPYALFTCHDSRSAMAASSAKRAASAAASMPRSTICSTSVAAGSPVSRCA